MNELKRICLLVLLAGLPGYGAEQAQVQMEIYSVPADLWRKVPDRMRENDAELRLKLLQQSRSGKVLRRDTVGGQVVRGITAKFEAVTEFMQIIDFAAISSGVIPAAWDLRSLGNLLELETKDFESVRLGGEYICPDPPFISLLSSGSPTDRERTKFPRPALLRFSASVPMHPVTLVSIAPDPDRSLKEPHLMLLFLVCQVPESKSGAGSVQDSGFVEVLGLLGPSGGAKSDPKNVLSALQGKDGGELFHLGLRTMAGQQGVIESIEELTHATEAAAGPTGPIPQEMETINHGSVLDAKFSPGQTEGFIQLSLGVAHDLRDPVTPRLPGKDGALIEQIRQRFLLARNLSLEIPPNEWVILAEIPMTEGLGEIREAEGKSCYLLGRIRKAAGP